MFFDLSKHQNIL